MPPNQTDQDQAHIDIGDTVSFLAQSGGTYVKAKAELAAIEAKEAASQMGAKAAAGAKAAFFGVFAYIMLMATLIGVGTQLLQGHIPQLEEHVGTWPIVTTILFLLHIIIAVIFIDKLKKAGNTPLFTLTKSELEKDKQWLQEMKQNSGS